MSGIISLLNRYQKLKLSPNRFYTFLKLALAHKIGMVIIGSIFVFVVGSIGVREKFVSSLTAARTVNPFNGLNPLSAATNFTDPNQASPSADESPSPDSSVLGDSSDTSLTDTTTDIPTYSSPVSTVVPTSTPTPVPSVSYTSSASTYYNNGNPNCTSAPGLPNFWYSGSSVSSNTISVSIKDCQKNLVSANDKIKICVTSNSTSTDCNNSDSSAQANGSSLPSEVVTSGGSASLSMSSQISGTDYFYIYDETNGFSLTDSSNHNPSVSFTQTATPVPSASPSPSPSATDSPSPSPSPS